MSEDFKILWGFSVTLPCIPLAMKKKSDLFSWLLLTHEQLYKLLFTYKVWAPLCDVAAPFVPCLCSSSLPSGTMFWHFLILAFLPREGPPSLAPRPCLSGNYSSPLMTQYICLLFPVLTPSLTAVAHGTWIHSCFQILWPLYLHEIFKGGDWGLIRLCIFSTLDSDLLQ